MFSKCHFFTKIVISLKIPILIKNPKVDQKFQCGSKILTSIKNPNFDKKIRILIKNAKFDQKPQF